MGFRYIQCFTILQLFVPRILFAQSTDTLVYASEIIDGQTIYYKEFIKFDSIYNKTSTILSVADTGTTMNYVPYMKDASVYWVRNDTLTNLPTIYEQFININFDISNTVIWQNYYRHSTIRDAYGRKRHEQEEYYDGTLNTWIGERKSEWKYENDSILCEQIVFLWDKDSSIWYKSEGWTQEQTLDTLIDSNIQKTVLKRSYENGITYDHDSSIQITDFNERILSYTVYHKENRLNSSFYGVWSNRSKKERAYDSSDHLIWERSYTGQGFEWAEGTSDIYVYDVATDALIEQSTYSHIDGDSSLIAVLTYDYGDTYREMRSYVYDSSVMNMRGITKEILEFDLVGRLLVKVQYGSQQDSYGLTEDDSWQRISKEVYTYAQDNLSFEYLKFGVNKKGLFEPRKRLEYQFIDILEPDIKDEQNTLLSAEVAIYKGEENESPEWKQVYPNQN